MGISFVAWQRVNRWNRKYCHGKYLENKNKEVLNIKYYKMFSNSNDGNYCHGKYSGKWK